MIFHLNLANFHSESQNESHDADATSFSTSLEYGYSIPTVDARESFGFAASGREAMRQQEEGYLKDNYKK